MIFHFISFNKEPTIYIGYEIDNYVFIYNTNICINVNNVNNSKIESNKLFNSFKKENFTCTNKNTLLYYFIQYLHINFSKLTNEDKNLLVEVLNTSYVYEIINNNNNFSIKNKNDIGRIMYLNTIFEFINKTTKNSIYLPIIENLYTINNLYNNFYDYKSLAFVIYNISPIYKYDVNINTLDSNDIDKILQITQLLASHGIIIEYEKYSFIKNTYKTIFLNPELYKNNILDDIHGILCDFEDFHYDVLNNLNAYKDTNFANYVLANLIIYFSILLKNKLSDNNITQKYLSISLNILKNSKNDDNINTIIRTYKINELIEKFNIQKIKNNNIDINNIILSDQQLYKQLEIEKKILTNEY